MIGNQNTSVSNSCPELGNGPILDNSLIITGVTSTENLRTIMLWTESYPLSARQGRFYTCPI